MTGYQLNWALFVIWAALMFSLWYLSEIVNLLKDIRAELRKRDG